MAWVKLDDQMPRHPKVRDLSDRAFRVYVTAMCETSEFLDDGYVTVSQVKGMKGTPKVVAELVNAGCLRIAPEGGFYIHGYLKRNPSKEKVEKRREVAAKRLRDWRETHGETS